MKGLREKVIEDYRFPFRISDSEYFDYFMELYKDDFNVERPWKDLQQAAKEIGENNLKTYSQELTEKIIADIRSKEEFLNFNSAEMPDIPKRNFEVIKDSPYKIEFDNCELISVRIKKADFEILKNFDSAIVNNCNNYQEFISGYTILCVTIS